MKSLRIVGFADIAASLDRYSTIIDARSEGEYAEDHLPGAINCPVLNDAERVRVGTLYKQVSPFEAKKIGAALVARNIANHLETRFIDQPRDWHPLVYCWRGGNRSGSMAHILAKVGWQTDQLDGGYKAYRRQVVADLDAWAERFTFRVICGTTGSGKSRLLRTLAAQGAQVLDLEQLAAHRGSVLGRLPDEQQPSQKMFESRLWGTLRRLDPRQPVYVESESKKVGAVHVPDRLMAAIRAADCIELHAASGVRIELLLDEYQHFTGDARDALQQQLSYLTPLHGAERIANWSSLIGAGDWRVLVWELLDLHYDPSYLRSMQRNFRRFETRLRVELAAYNDTGFERIAERLRASETTGEDPAAGTGSA